MHDLIIAAVCLVVGAGCGYGFRGWIGHKRDAVVREAKNVSSSIGKHL